MKRKRFTTSRWRQMPFGHSSSAALAEQIMEPIESVYKILEYRGRGDLADLLNQCKIDFNVSDSFGRKARYSRLTTVETRSTIEICEQLRRLPKEDKDLIVDSFLEIFTPQENDMEISDLEFFVDPVTPVEDMREKIATLISEIESQKNLMVAVATGGPRINSVNNKYKERRIIIQSLLNELGISDPNAFSDLWDWYGKWSGGDLPSYQSRREYLKDLYQPLIDRLYSPPDMIREPTREPTGWERVDRGIDKARDQLARAKNEEDYQAVGFFCREVLISLAQSVYNPEIHRTVDGVIPSSTDAKRMLEAYVESVMSGESNKESRNHAKSSLNLANKLVHLRRAQFRDAAQCAEATSSVINIVAIASGRRDPIK